MLRIARDSGDISSLFPPDVRSLADVPFTLFNAIRMGMWFLSFEELPKDERPDKSIWLNAELMDEHWRGVEERRKLKAEGHDVSDMTDMPRNAYLKQLIVR
jgi:hypothetical protein